MIKNNSIRKLKRDVEAISPVIATILLVLVAVASAVAFYAFTSAWQNEQQGNLDKVDILNDNEVSISGSTTVTPFMEVAAARFMDSHPAYTVTVSGTGSSAGIAAAAGKTADIGMISKAWGGADAAANPALKHTVIAYDGVVVAISEAAASAHGITSAMLGALTQDIIHDVYAGDITTWGDFADALAGEEVSSDAATINLYQRAEGSGTEEGFCEMILGEGKTYLDSNNAIEGVQGNPGMITALQQDPNGIGFTSYGMVVAEDSGLVCFAFGETSADIVAPSPATIKDGSYPASRPLVILTYGEPTGATYIFIQYILEVNNNKAFCDEVGYVSLY